MEVLVLEQLMEIVNMVSKVLWDYILIFGLMGIGILMTIRLKFPQFSRVLPALKKMITGIIKNEKPEDGKMTPFQALSTAVAAQVGTGNIVGVATAIASGGPGAAFWMLLAAFFGMATIFSEAVLAQKYREEKNGELVGGPAYYMKNGLKSEGLAKFFAITAAIGLGVVGVMVQSNSIAGAVNSAFGVPTTIITVALALIVFKILIGGMDSIAKFSEKVVPVMALMYILGSLIIIVFNLNNLVPAVKSIFIGAFTPQAIGGGALGITIQQTVRFGLARGLFSNEAGLGSTPHSHAVADTTHPAEQGFVAMIGVFISTFLICLSTVMVNITSGSYNATISASKMAESATIMTQNGFYSVFGNFGAMFLAICLSFFSLTTIVGWYFFAEANVKFLFSSKKSTLTFFKIISVLALSVGTFINPTYIWQLVDLFTGLMALPNIITLFILSSEVKEVLYDYDRCNKQGFIHWEYAYQNIEKKEKKHKRLKSGLSTTIIK